MGCMKRLEPAQLLTLKQVAQQLACAVITVRRLCRMGALRCVRMGRQIRVDSDDLLAFIEARKT